MKGIGHIRQFPPRQAIGRLVLAFTVLTLSACSSTGDKAPAEFESVDYTVISNNLVDALSQYTRANPLVATVQSGSPQSAFERQVHQELVDRGYKLDKVKAAQANAATNGVKAMVKIPETDAQGDVAPLYVVSIGRLSAERQFDITGDKTLPTSELVIRGGEKRSVTLNDAEIFEFEDESLSTVAFIATDSMSIEDVLRPESALETSTTWAQPKPAPLKWNVYDTMQSNYVSMYADYEDVDRSILVFPNDSLRLGETNKDIIERYVAKMDPETDVLSVIGCSHGTTGISNGNSLLALGRANRVKEAFLFSGVKHEHVMDEGCWAPQAFDEVMPRRGVVLTLKRRKSS